LITSSNLLDCATGSSAGFAPLRTLVHVVSRKLMISLKHGAVCDQSAMTNELADPRSSADACALQSRDQLVNSIGSPNTRRESEPAHLIVAKASFRSSQAARSELERRWASFGLEHHRLCVQETTLSKRPTKAVRRKTLFRV